MISASHNSFEDNGVKFFSDLGLKLPDNIELQIEALLDKEINSIPPNEIGKARRIDDAIDKYVSFCKGTVDSNFSLIIFSFLSRSPSGTNTYLGDVSTLQSRIDYLIF